MKTGRAAPKTDYMKLFKAEVEKIDKLQETPNIIKQQATSAINHALQLQGLPHTAKVSLQNAKQSLDNIGQSSINENFKTIYNQMCILAVSSLEAILKKYFINAVNNYENLNKDHKKLKEIKISVLEVIQNNLRFGGKLGQLIVDKDSPNFQDLKSIKNTFKNYISKDINISKEIERKICFYLELRHVLVHKGGRIDQKFVDATEKFGANIKNLKLDDQVELNHADWDDIKECLSELIAKVVEARTGMTDNASSGHQSIGHGVGR